MKTRKPIIMIVMLFISCIMTACQSEEKKYEAMGLTFVTIADSSSTFYKSKYNAEEQDHYLCIVDGQKVERDTLSIPATYQHKKVLLVTSQNENATLQKLTLPEGVQYVYDAFESFTALKTITLPKSLIRLDNAFAKCTALESITFPGPVQSIINYSYNDCTSLKEVEFQDTIDEINQSFRFCQQLKEVYLPLKTVIQYDSFNVTKVIKGYHEAVAFSESYINSEQIKAQALTHLAEDFDSRLQKSAYDMSQYRDQVNGPIVTMDRCPDCEKDAYGKDQLPKSLALTTIEVYTVQKDYPDTLFSEEKAERIKNHEPIIYCFVEMMGYSAGPNYTFGGSNVGSYLHYRLSVWNFSTNELLGWCTLKAGEAPYSFTVGKDKITFSVPFGETGTKNFFLEGSSEPSPLYVVEKNIFRGSKQ